MNANRLLAAATVAVAISGCGNSVSGTRGDSNSGPVRSSLKVTVPGGKTFDVTPTEVTCGPGEYEHGVDVVRVRYSTKDYRLQIEVIPGDVVGGKTFKLPINSGDSESGPKNALIFFGARKSDPSTGEGVEASTDEEESTGTLRVRRATCNPVALDLEVDANLGSELFDGSGAELRGRVVLPSISE
ncbi:hypothetical protein [Nocardioides marmorisolisilvae]|uniref:hypothetical protein n=1 Tax=Nocardioides marmorisolisilvae TaxID=1542737 RepID=UPI0011CEB540|nr:hypothetical protein [Nocardioides marmorisolisilvae]